MLKNKRGILMKNEKGFTVAELSVAILIMIIFIGMISTIFMNIYLSFMESKRYSAAMMYSTQIAEKIDQLLFEEVTTENLLDIEIGKGYDKQVTVETNSENTLKTVNITISYYVGQNLKSVELKKTKVKDNSVIPNAPDVQEGMVPVRYVEEEQGGYWVIASSDSANWYNYYSNEWANVMLLDGIITR